MEILRIKANIREWEPPAAAPGHAKGPGRDSAFDVSIARVDKGQRPIVLACWIKQEAVKAGARPEQALRAYELIEKAARGLIEVEIRQTELVRPPFVLE